MCLFGHLYILWRFIYSLKLLAQLKIRLFSLILLWDSLYIWGINSLTSPPCSSSLSFRRSSPPPPHQSRVSVFAMLSGLLVPCPRTHWHKLFSLLFYYVNRLQLAVIWCWRSSSNSKEAETLGQVTCFAGLVLHHPAPLLKVDRLLCLAFRVCSRDSVRIPWYSEDKNGLRKSIKYILTILSVSQVKPSRHP